MFIKKSQHHAGFTLIELLVSIGLFSVVLTVALSAILTMADSNKKARTLMSVMNNLNFAVDSMTRSFKSGDITGITNPNGTGGDCFSTNEADYDTEGGTRSVTYCINLGAGSLQKTVGGDTTSLVSSDVVIQKGTFKIFNSTGQPQLVIILEGEVKISDKIKSKFSIHTSVSQRKLINY